MRTVPGVQRRGRRLASCPAVRRHLPAGPAAAGQGAGPHSPGVTAAAATAAAVPATAPVL